MHKLSVITFLSIGILALTACTPESPTPTLTQPVILPTQAPYPIDPYPYGEPPTPTGVVEPVEPYPLQTPALDPILIPWGGSEILFASDRDGDYLDLYLLDLVSGAATRLTAGDSNTFPGPFGPDGRMLFTGFGLTTSYVGVRNAFGTEPIDLSQHPDSDEAFPTWSPDGAQIAFTSRRDGNNEIYVMNSDSSGQTRLTNAPGDDFAPAWSPDGTRIAFVSDRDNEPGVNDLFLMDVDGSNLRRLTTGAENVYSPTWSPDASWIAYRAHVDGAAADIYLITPDATIIVQVTNDPAEDWAPAWSPDGNWLAFQTDRDGNWEIYATQIDGSGALNLTNNPADDQMPYWK